MGAQVGTPLCFSLPNKHTNVHAYLCRAHTPAAIQIYNTLLLLIEPFWTALRAKGFHMITSQKHSQPGVIHISLCRWLALSLIRSYLSLHARISWLRRWPLGKQTACKVGLIVRSHMVQEQRLVLQLSRVCINNDTQLKLYSSFIQ